MITNIDWRLGAVFVVALAIVTVVWIMRPQRLVVRFGRKFIVAAEQENNDDDDTT